MAHFISDAQVVASEEEVGKPGMAKSKTDPVGVPRRLSSRRRGTQSPSTSVSSDHGGGRCHGAQRSRIRYEGLH